MSKISDERREVAARLRTDVSKEECIDYAVFCIIHDVLGVEGAWGAKAAGILADLIEPQERTCHMEHIEQAVGFTLKCDVCGNELGAYETEVERYAYCPNCGARVVTDDGRD